ncbi:MAG: sterol carrier family protein [Mycobacteriales bacterium]
MAARRADPGRVLAAVLAQADAVSAWLSGQPPSAWRRPSVLPGWTVLELAEHVAVVLRSTPATLRRTTGDRPVSIARYASGGWCASWCRDDDTNSHEPAEEVLAGLYAARDVAAATELPAARAVRAGRDPVAPADYLVTRAIELVVHADDLSRSLPERAPVPLDRAALRVACQALADVLAERAPGHSLELRVPPYAAVQALQGPRHTRGTPPNVVETDPVTWVRLATGRLSWADAVPGRSVQARGERADLAPWLPLL